MKPEDFFPLDWLDRPFRRQPYPDKTYRAAFEAAKVILWNIGTEEAIQVHDALDEVLWNLRTEHDEFAGRSVQVVALVSALWSGRVTTLLKWFQTKEGAK